MDGWISNALARGVLDLDLGISTDSDEEDNYQLSPKCFECSTLVSLKIHRGIAISLVAGRILLQLLKTLVLDTVPVCPNEFGALLQALPSLEELVLTHVLWKGMEDVTVSSASVKTLTIKSIGCLNTLSLDTPSLLHFKYSGSVAWDYLVVNMGNLVDAQINFFLSEFDIKLLREPNKGSFDVKIALGYSNVWKLFYGIRNVRNLELFPDTPEVFNKLKSLDIWSDKDRGWKAMTALLKNSPHLETLIIQGLLHRVTDKCGDVCDCISREDKGLSLTLCPVKVMEIHGFQGTMKEMAMTKHFLDYFPCLKEMQVYADNYNLKQLRNHGVFS